MIEGGETIAQNFPILWVILAIALAVISVVGSIMTVVVQYRLKRKAKQEDKSETYLKELHEIKGQNNRMLSALEQETHARKLADIEQAKLALSTLMIVYIRVTPGAHEDIIRIAQRYFCELQGDWVMDTMFQRWLDDEGIPAPAWFKQK